MAEPLTEAKLKENLARAHKARAEAPMLDKLKIFDELQEAALDFAKIRFAEKAGEI
jgi:hypothetical protein